MGTMQFAAGQWHRAKIGVEVFDLGGPVAEEGVFEAGAGRPADLGVAVRREASGLTCA